MLDKLDKHTVIWKKSLNNHQIEDRYISHLDAKTDIIFKSTLYQICNAKVGYLGSALSCLHILISLYFSEMKHFPHDPANENRDRFVLSKGHAVPALYACLAEAGYFDKKQLSHFGKIYSMLPGNPDASKTPGVDCSSGSPGMGLSLANGMALALKLKKSNAAVFCLIGDGEMHEGQIWEAMMFAAHYELNNVCVIIDFNNFHMAHRVSETKSLDLLDQRLSSFGWEVVEAGGHDYADLLCAYEVFRNNQKLEYKPTCIIANTRKGFGLKDVEGKIASHKAIYRLSKMDEIIKAWKGALV